MRIQRKIVLLFCLLFPLVCGCAALDSQYETPAVSITSFKAIETEDIIPRFQIGLHIVNPNRTPLNLVGISYSIALEGHKILTGVSNKLPRIEAYGEGSVILNASVDVFNTIGFFTDMFRNRTKKNISYTLKTKLDTGGMRPFIRVNKEGLISLDGLAKNQE
jgi:LEA14-like dessication related protein